MLGLVYQEIHAGPQLLAGDAGSCYHASKRLTKPRLMQAAAMLKGA